MLEPDAPSKSKLPRSAEEMIRHVGASEARMIRGQSEAEPGFWRSAGMLGMIGWSVAAPILLGIALGIWIDRSWPSRFSWTLMLLIVGVVTGCATAWVRIKHEQERR